MLATLGIEEVMYAAPGLSRSHMVGVLGAYVRTIALAAPTGTKFIDGAVEMCMVCYEHCSIPRSSSERDRTWNIVSMCNAG